MKTDTLITDDLTDDYFKSLLNWAFKNILLENEDPELRRAEFLGCCNDPEKLLHFEYASELDQCEPHFAYPWFRKVPGPDGLEQQVYLSLGTAIQAAKELGLELNPLELIK